MPSPSQKIPFPFKGLNTTVGYDDQPLGTTPDAVNVRGFDSIENRLRGGRRPGLSKVFDFDFGGPIQSVKEISQSALPAGLPESPQEEGLDAVAPPSPRDPGPGWVVLRNYLRDWDAFSSQRGTETVRPAFLIGNGVIKTDDTGNDTRNRVVLRTTKKTDRITAVASAVPQGNTFSLQVDKECTLYRLYIRGGTLNIDALGFGLREVNTGNNDNVVEPHIYVVADDDFGSGLPDATSFTNLWVGDEIPLSGGSTPTSMTLTFENVSDEQVFAKVSWPDENVEQEVLLNTTTLGDKFHPFAAVGRAAISNNQGSGVEFTSVSVRAVTPPSRGVLTAMDSGDANAIGTGRFFLPAGLTATDPDIDSRTSVGPVEDSSEFGLEGVHIDTTLSAFASSDTSEPTVLSSNPTSRPSVSYKWRLSPDGTFADISQGIRMWTRVSDGFRSGLEVQGFVISNVNGDSRTAAVGGSPSNNFFRPRVRTVINGSTGSNTPSIVFSGAIFAREGDPIELVDPGLDGPTTLEYWVNGVLCFEFDMAAEDLDSANFPELYDSNGDSWRRTGIALDGTIGNADDRVPGTIEWLDTSLQPEGGEEPTPEPDAAAITSELLIIANGDVFRSGDNNPQVANGGGGVVIPNIGRIGVQSAYGKSYIVDGTSNLEFSRQTGEVATWTASKGDVPAGARIIALYRGRLVLSGVNDDPNNWFMSRLGDPNDWDFFPPNESDPTIPVAGNNSPAGLVGDSITALIPFSDDVLLFGAANSFWQLTGDPAAGGAIDLVSDKFGVAPWEAWTRSPDNTIYFVGTDGVYSYRFGETPINITRNRLDDVFREIDLDANFIRMEWDLRRHGFYIVILPALQSGGDLDSFFYDARNDAWWRDDWGSRTPTYIYAYDGPALADKATIFGGSDGALRQIDEDSPNDDGEDLTSRVRFRHFAADDASREVKMSDVIPVMARDSANTTLSLYSGQSVEDVVDAQSPRWAKTLRAGRNGGIRQRVRGAVLQLELSHTTGSTGPFKWALESLSAVIRGAGRARRLKR